MGTGQPCIRGSFQSDRTFRGAGIISNLHLNSYNRHGNYQFKFINFWKLIALLFIINTPVKANTTVASPSSSSQGTVVNNGYQIMGGPNFQNRYPNGIQCQQSSLSIQPFVTRGKNWMNPWYLVKEQPVYNNETNDDGSLKYPGRVEYNAQTNVYPQDSFNLSTGITAAISIPLDRRFQKACLRSVEKAIETQDLLLQEKRLSMELSRLKLCSAQAKLGATFVGDYKVSCEGIQVSVPPGQVKPHHHSISSSQ